MKPKTAKNRRPWNRVSQQIYSLSTLDTDGKINMNIVSYATAATLKPKSYVIAVYRGTKTHANIFDKSAKEYFLLQGLAKPQSRYIRPLGQKSGLRSQSEQRTGAGEQSTSARMSRALERPSSGRDRAL
jgi:hypothetical protein